MWTPRTRSLALLLALSLATPLLCLPSAADAGFLERALRRLVGKVRIEPKTLVLDLRDDLEPEELAAFGRKYGIKLTPNSPHSRADRFFTIKTGLPDILLRRLITRLRKDPAVARAERAYLYHALDFPNDPYFKQQWNITMAGARSAWRWSRGERVTVAVIDTWTNLRKRFTEGGETVEPDAVCVVDEEMREQMDWCGARLHVTGQPHLQSVVDRLAPRRAGRGASDPPLLVFFSEPLSRDYGAEDVGFDEFGVADALLSGIAGAGPLTLLVQPHPREDREEWRAWLSGRHGVADVSTEDLLVTCDGALGMTTMVLFEAALLGVPVLSLQPGRRRPLNPRLDAVKGLHRVTDDADIGPALARFLGALGEAVSIDHGLSDVIANADQRLLAAIEKELPAGCRQPQGAAST